MQTFEFDHQAEATAHDVERRLEHSRGHADYHDPLACLGTAPPAYSALTLRLTFAIIGLLVCTAGAVLFALITAPVVFVVLVAVFAARAVVDIAVVVRRKLRGEPG
jgi:Family of unknown function (DUF6343)